MKSYNEKNRAWEYLLEHKLQKRWQKITVLLAVLVVIVITTVMTLPALTMEKESDTLCCQLNTHTHVDGCYDEDGNPVCGYADFVVHTHDDSCYHGDTLICPLNEIQVHTHEASCYQDILVQICDLEETEGHVHSAQCYEGVEELICGKEEAEPHKHNESCYDAEGTLICEKSEEGHWHTEECYSSEKKLVCGKKETSPHTHTGDCFETQKKLICGKDEIVLHTHTSHCYDGNGRLICDKTEVLEHVHDETCVPEEKEKQGARISYQNETSWATVERFSSSAAEKRLAAANNARAASINFAQYITNFTLSREVDGQWVPVTTEVTSGDSIKVHISYTMPENTVTADSKVIHYQLPAGIGLREQASGPVTIGNKDAGAYTISTGGLIQITFNSDFADGSAFTGELEFQGTVTATGEEGNDSIDLGFDGGIIVVKPDREEKDLTITKAGNYDKSQNLITYRIAVSTETGTDGTVTIEDAFIHAPEYGVINYKEDSISLQKVDTQGQITYPFTSLEEIRPHLTVMQQTKEKAATFVLKDLPALQKGESYILTYSAVPDLNSLGNGNGYLQFSNKAVAKDQVNTAEATANVQVSKAMISKEYTYDVLTRKIKWTIYVNEDQRDISGWTLKDTLTYTADGQEHTMKLPEKVTITALWDYAPTGESYEISLPYTFPQNSKAQYVITYETEIPTNISSDSTIIFHNTASVGDYWVKVDVEGPTIGDYGVVKGSLGSDSNTGIVHWAATIARPNPPELEKLHYADLLSGAVTEDGSQFMESHYTTKNLLSFLAVWTVDGKTRLEYGTDYTIMAISKADVKSFMENNDASIEDLSWLVAEYDFSDMVEVFNWRDISAFSSDEPLGMFAVVFYDSVPEKISEQNLLITYDSRIDKGSLPEGTKKVTVYNLGRIPDDYSLTQAEMTFYQKIDKQASPDGTEEGSRDTGSFTDSSLTVNSGDTGELLHYRIMITDYGEKTEITVTDILPAGVELVEDSVMLRRHPNSWNTYTDETKDTYYLQEITADKNDDGTTTVTFRLGHLNDLEKDTFGIYYDVSVAGDVELEEKGEKTYTNTASWDGISDSTTTTVKYSRPHLEKTGEKLTDEDSLRYYVIINPEGERLNPYDENLTLKDTLTIPEGTQAFFEPNTVKLYQYDENAKDNHFCGTQIDSSQYGAEYDSETHTITFTLPDSTACVLVYDYSVDRGSAAGDLSISNVAQLSGSADYSSESDLVIEEEQSSATVNKATMTIFKYESGNMTHLLAGAKFRLQRYEKTTGVYEWHSTSLTATGDDGEFIVGEDGMIVFNFLSEEQGGGSLYNTLYRLEETAAPEGYLKADGYYYFVWMKEGATEESTIDAMRAEGAFGDVPAEQVDFIPYSTSKSIYVPNDVDHLTVTKKWRDDDGAVLIQPPVDSVTVTLYQWTQDGKKTAYGENAELTADNHWSYSWRDLPKTDSEGNDYRYTVEETSVSGFEITYSENNEEGLQTGLIEITNTKKGYVLPETGGMGTAFFTAAGTLLIAVSGLGYGYIRYRRRRYHHVSGK